MTRSVPLNGKGSFFGAYHILLFGCFLLLFLLSSRVCNTLLGYINVAADCRIHAISLQQ